MTKRYQTTTQTGGGSNSSNSVVTSTSEDYLIGASDIIEIKVEDAPEISGKYRLNSKGAFTLNEVGEVTAKDKTTDEIAHAITEKLRGGYLVNPLVTVSVAQSNSRAYFIQGAVRNPGIYQIEGKTSLLKLITIAGGLSENYGPNAFIMREGKVSDQPIIKDEVTSLKPVEPNTEVESTPDISQSSVITSEETEDLPKEDYKLINANINNLLRGNFVQNIGILPGDIVYIPPTDVFYVVGEVKAPGSFPLKENTTLRQAVSLAQGTNFEANLDKSLIFRTDLTTGRREEVKVDVAAVMAGKQDDISILPNDVLIIPNSKKKTVAKSLGKTLGGSLPMVLMRSIGIF